MKKILFIGPEITDFLNPLAKYLKDHGNISGLLELRKIKNIDKIKENYSVVYDYDTLIKNRPEKRYFIKYFFKMSIYKYFINELYKALLANRINIISILKYALKRIHLRELFYGIFMDYDIVNFHSLNPYTLLFIDCVKEHSKIILTFWGSDLYQINGLDNYYVQHSALIKSDIITVGNHEMEQTILAKFGNIMKEKIHHLNLGSNDSIYSIIDDLNEKKISISNKVLSEIPVEKIKITIGYNGNEISNHYKIVKELVKLEIVYLKQIHLLIPMTYGNSSDKYKNELKNIMINNNVSFTIIDKYLTDEETAFIRFFSDIMIQMSNSDGFSASVCEYLYSGNILIAGVWLPYSVLRLNDVKYFESDFDRLSSTLHYVMDNITDIKSKIIENPIKVKKLKSFESYYNEWMKIYS